MDTALEILKLGMVGLIAGLFSSVLANRDHRQRKWWELRVTAYQNAIEALSDLVYYYDKQYEVEIEYQGHSEEFKKKLDTYGKSLFRKLENFLIAVLFYFQRRQTLLYKI
jgi:hypothetical protein